MLPQRYRLRRTADIQRLRREGRSWHHPLMILLAQPTNQPVSRFAFAVSRRVGKAVTRNRARRLMREAVRLHLPEIVAGWDCLFIGRSSLPMASFAEVEAAVLQLLSRARLLLKNPVSKPG